MTKWRKHKHALGTVYRMSGRRWCAEVTVPNHFPNCGVSISRLGDPVDEWWRFNPCADSEVSLDKAKQLAHEMLLALEPETEDNASVMSPPFHESTNEAQHLIDAALAIDVVCVELAREAHADYDNDGVAGEALGRLKLAAQLCREQVRES